MQSGKLVVHTFSKKLDGTSKFYVADGWYGASALQQNRRMLFVRSWSILLHIFMWSLLHISASLSWRLLRRISTNLWKLSYVNPEEQNLISPPNKDHICHYYNKSKYMLCDNLRQYLKIFCLVNYP
jgi:hypothetical protein